jgi:hypothetical protein
VGYSLLIFWLLVENGLKIFVGFEGGEDVREGAKG